MAIGDLHIVRHQKGSGAHDGGHNLTAGGGGSFRGTGKLGLITGLLHKGNGHGAGAHRIGNRRAGHNAEQCAGHNSHLGRAAGEPAHQSIGQLNKILGNTGALQERAKHNEYHNELGADIDGGGQDALLAIEEVADGVVQLAPQGRIGKPRRQRIDQEAGGHKQNGQAHASAANLRQRQDADDADDDLIGMEQTSLLNNGDGVGGVVEKGAGAQNHHNHIIPGNMIHPLVALSGRKHQKAQKHNPGNKGGEPQFFQPAGKQGNIQAEQRKRGQDHIHHDPGLSLPDADIGLLVKFFHNGVQIHGLLQVRFRFLKKLHGGSSLFP